MAYPPQHPPPPSQPRRGGVRPWHLVVAASVVCMLAVAVLAFVLALSSGGDDAVARADMEQRWDELDMETRIETCANWETSEELTVTVFVESFEERAQKRGEDITVSRDVARDFLADKCG